MAVITPDERKRMDAKEQQRLKQLTTIDKLIDRVGKLEQRVDEIHEMLNSDTKIIEGDYADIVELGDALGFNGKPVTKPLTPTEARDKLQANYQVDDPIAHLPPNERDNIINTDDDDVDDRTG